MTSELDFKTRQEMGKNIKKGSQGRNRRSRGKSPERANRTDRGNSPDRGNRTGRGNRRSRGKSTEAEGTSM